MGSYTISINLTGKGFVLRANPDHPQSNRKLSSFYGDETGLITFERSGKPAGPKSGTFTLRMWKEPHTIAPLAESIASSSRFLGKSGARLTSIAFQFALHAG
jgi:hypothetical protein